MDEELESGVVGYLKENCVFIVVCPVRLPLDLKIDIGHFVDEKLHVVYGQLLRDHVELDLELLRVDYEQVALDESVEFDCAEADLRCLGEGRQCERVLVFIGVFGF